MRSEPDRPKPTRCPACLRAPGTNCDRKRRIAFEQAGAQGRDVARQPTAGQSADRGRSIRSSACRADSATATTSPPGGFGQPDPPSPERRLGRIQGAGKLILGICNGFQVLIKSGVLLGRRPQGTPATLTWNDSGRYEDRWVHWPPRTTSASFCKAFSRCICRWPMPKASSSRAASADLDALARAGQLVLRYTGPTAISRGAVSRESQRLAGNVAGVCDETGRVLGLMPHPERHIDPTQHPQWTRRPRAKTGRRPAHLPERRRVLCRVAVVGGRVGVVPSRHKNDAPA